MEVDKTPALVQLVYTSAATSDFEAKELDAILRVARDNNDALDVTGMLLFADGSFFQVLEGASDTVEELYEHISNDPRHGKVALLLRRELSERVFGNWTMGYARMTLGELSTVVGVNDFFQAGECFTQLDTSHAKKLIGAFRDGAYRQRIA